MHPMKSASGLLLAALLVGGCQDSGQAPAIRPEPPPSDEPEASRIAPVDLVYLCGNRFLVTNSSSSALRVEYRVAETGEAGVLSLEAGPGGDPGFSETEFETGRSGEVELYLDDVRVARSPNYGHACGTPAVSAAMGAAGPEASVGQWSAPFPWRSSRCT